MVTTSALASCVVILATAIHQRDMACTSPPVTSQPAPPPKTTAATRDLFCIPFYVSLSPCPPPKLFYVHSSDRIVSLPLLSRARQESYHVIINVPVPMNGHCGRSSLDHRRRRSVPDSRLGKARRRNGDQSQFKPTSIDKNAAIQRKSKRRSRRKSGNWEL